MNQLARIGTLSIFFLTTACSTRLPEPSAEVTVQAQLQSSTGTPPQPTASPAATMTLKEAIFPFTIAGLIEHDYQGGDIEIRSLVEKTDEYSAYLIAYPSDGLTITGILQIPSKGKPPFPVIIMNHGYFYRGDYQSGDGTDRASAYLNRHGYLTISSDYRSWGGSEVGPSLFYSGLVIDVINLINSIPSINQADPNRVGMWGHSMGGGVTVKVLTVDSRVEAAVLYSTVSADDADLIARWGAGCIGDVYENELLYGCNSSDILPLDLPPELLTAYQQAAYDSLTLMDISSIHHLDRISIPIQIGFGTEDGKSLDGTPPEWSRKLFEALKDADVRAELFAYPGETHSFIGNEWVAFMERSAHFFDKYVK